MIHFISPAQTLLSRITDAVVTMEATKYTNDISVFEMMTLPKEEFAVVCADKIAYSAAQYEFIECTQVLCN